MADADPAADAIGHRARLRERLATAGGEALHDHELLEFILALGRPRIDTKPTAKALLREFGGIGGVLTAEPEALIRVHGMGEKSAAAIRIGSDATISLFRR